MEEILPIVNEKGETIGKAARSECHSGSKLLHPVVHLHLINAKGEIFLQKRSITKKLLPGYWDTAVGGHISYGEDTLTALHRETMEELGLTQFKAERLATYLWESKTEREFINVFICREYGTFTIDNDEVDEGKFWSKEEIEAAIDTNTLTPNFEHEYLTILKTTI